MAIIKNRNKRRDDDRKRPFLNRLLEDNRGNTLAIIAAALIPLTAMIGSGVDMARAYMAQSRLQLACDAAALGGRRAMSSGTVDDTVKTEAKKFFNFNFKTGTDGVAGTAAFGAKGFVPVVDADPSSASTVRVTASTTIPTSVMQIMGFTTLPISATCNAKQDFVNTDIVLVLDTTGSMDETVSGVKKIVALRDAVKKLYATLAPVQQQLEGVGLRLRYAVVPYSTTTNVGKLLYGTNNSNGWIRTSQKYQQCTAYDWRGNCTAATQTVPPVSHTASWFTNNWNGCIEERKTDSSITTSTNMTIPSTAWDLNMALIPNSDDDSKWGANDPAQETAAATDDDSRACPYSAVRLKAWSQADFDTYLPNLNAQGYTYHDTGVMWGMHMLDRTGIWAADNPTTYGNMPVSRYMIFLTDGTPVSAPTAYTSWGVEQYDKRITGGATSTEQARHVQRFKMMCTYAKNQSISIWVVGLDTTLDSNTASCASNSSQVSTASTAQGLIDKFAEIGKTIGALRLTK